MRRYVFQNKFFLNTLIVCFLGVVLSAPAHAAMIGTESLAGKSTLPNNELLAKKREYLQKQLVEYGVKREDASQRVAQLTAEEVVTLSSSLEESPAGGGFLTIAAVVFLVLLATDILGYTDIFPFVNKSANGSQGPIVTEN